MKRQGLLLTIALLTLLLADLSFTFYQHMQMPLDGDLAESLLPDDFVKNVLADPFAMNVLLNDEYYPNPNRFFAHGSLLLYMRNAPLLLQNFLSPIDSIYAAGAVIKCITQFLMVVLLAMFIKKKNQQAPALAFILPALLITPLFQTEGYNRYMGIIDQSVSYVFFYAFPFALLLLFCLLIYKLANGANKNWLALTLPLAIILPFSSPLIPGVVLIAGVVFVVYLLKNCKVDLLEMHVAKALKNSLNSIPAVVVFSVLLITVMSGYSLYIGTHNTSNELLTVSLVERYSKLPSGLYYLLTQKPGWMLLISAIIINTLLIKYATKIKSSHTPVQVLKWIGLFSLIYILMLPLGGFREYRANIIRYDTFIPITLCCIYYFGLTSNFLITETSSTFKFRYIAFVVLILLAFTFADKRKSEGNTCERTALQEIATANGATVEVSSACTILSWHKITDYNESARNAVLLQHWGVTKKKTLYYQK